jgi:histidine triad (HIT) family protein
MSDNCIFCKIVKGEIPSRKVYEDDELLAFHDINPAAPVHFLLIPKKHIDSLQNVTAADVPLLGRMQVLIHELAQEQGCRPGPEGGFRVVVNNGVEGGQEVPHLHYHVLGGSRPWKRNI